MQTRAAIDSSMAGGEGGIRTLEHLLGCYSLSRRAPSTTRPPLRAAARVPEVTQAIKFTVAPNSAAPAPGAQEEGPVGPGASRGPPCSATPRRSAAAHRDTCPSAPAEAAQASRPG